MNNFEPPAENINAKRIKSHQIPSNPIETCFEGTGQEQICHWSLWPATGAAAVLALLAAAMAAVCEESAAFSEGRTHGVEGADEAWQVEKKWEKQTNWLVVWNMFYFSIYFGTVIINPN